MADENNKDEGEDAKSLGTKAEQLFFKSRNVIVTGEINHKLAERTVKQLLALAEDGDDPINLYISSPGGHVESGDMVHDMIKFIRPKIRTIGSGWVASAGALIFVGAARENRFCLPNTRFLLHQPSGGIGGSVTDMQIQADQIEKMRERFHRLFAAATGQKPAKIAKDTERDFWLDTQEAIDYGLLGKVIASSDELP